MIKGIGKNRDNELGMLYAAFALIMVGVLCFVYVSLSSDRPTKKERMSSSPRRGREEEGSPYAKAYRMPNSQSSTPWMDDRIRREREFNNGDHPFASNSYLAHPQAKKPAVVEQTAVLEPTPFGFQPVPETPEIESELSLSGTLYIDQSGKLPFGKSDLKDIQLSEEDVRNFRRVGPAELNEEGGKLVFHSKNTSFTFPAKEIDQVVFYHQGFVLIPREANSPRPVFFTKELDQMKEFLSQIRA